MSARRSSTRSADAGFYRQHRRRRAHLSARLLELVDYATAHQVGVKFFHQRVKITPAVAARLAASTTGRADLAGRRHPRVNDAVRGPGSYATAMRAMANLADAGSAASNCRWS